MAKDGPDPAQVADLVLADHILANEGVLDAWGHVSLRDVRNPNRFLLSRAVAPAIVTAADIVEYDLDQAGQGRREPLATWNALFTEKSTRPART